MNNLPVTVQATLDASRAAKSLDNLTRKREVVLAANFDAKSIAAANKPLGAIKRSADEFEKSMQAANARVLAFGTSVAVIEGMRRSFLSIIKTTAEVERSLTQIAVVARDDLQKAGISVEQYGNKIFNLAKKTGQSFDTASKATLEFTRQGIGLEESVKRTQTALELARISGAEYSDVIQGMTAAYNSFGSETLTFTKIAEKLVNVDNKTTTSLKGLFDVLSRTSSIAKTTGTSFEELLAVTATLKDVTGRSESVIGNAFKSISTKISSSEVLDKLSKKGIQVRDVNTNDLLKPLEILQNVAKAFQTITDASEKADITRAIGGLYQADQLNALLVGLTEASNGTSLYGENAKKAAQDVDALTQANKAFSENLVNRFNVIDVSIQQLLNSLGKLGIKDPLSNLLDSISSATDSLRETIDGEGIGSTIAQSFIKGFGGVVLGPTGLLTVGFAIGKILLDFSKFAFDAAKSFLSLNKTAKDQELIQKSILTTISQMPSILNGIENSESGRLLLAQRVSVEYERQLALASTLTTLSKGAAPSVYNSGFRITEKGLSKKGLRSASGYLPSLISSEMKDVRNGIGGANPNSKIVVMPNFPFGGGKKGLMVANSSEVAMKMGDGYGILNPNMMGKRAAEGDFPSSLSLSSSAVALKSGKFAPIKKIELALNQTISNFLDLGNGTKGLYQEIQKTLKEFQLTGNTFKDVSIAANDYARELVKNKKAAKIAYEQQVILNNQKKQEEAEMLRMQKIKEESIQKANAYASSTVTPAALSAIPYLGLGFSGNTSAKSSSSFGSFAPSSDVLARLAILSKDSSSIYGGLSKSNSSYGGNNLNSPIDVFGVSPKKTQIIESSSIYGNIGNGGSSFLGGNLNSPIDVFGVNKKEEISKTVEKTKTSLEGFAIKAFAISSAIDFVTAQFRGQSQQLDKFANALSTATIAASGFLFLNRSKGISIGSLLEGVGSFGGLGRKVGGAGKISSGISSAIGAVSTFGKGLVRFLPVIGQISLAGFVINEFSKVFSDKSIFDRVYQAFGGLSDSAEKAKDKFNEVANQIFDASGQYAGRSLAERRGSLEQTRESSIQRLNAQFRGVSTSGKNDQEIAAENFKKLLLEGIGGVSTGATRSLKVGTSGPGPIVADVQYQETIKLMSASAQEAILQTVQEVTGGTLEELRSLALSKGIKDINGIKTNEASRENLQKVLAKAFIQQFIKERVGQNFDLESVVNGELGQARLSGAGLKFIGKPPTSGKPSLQSGVEAPAQIPIEAQRVYLERAQDISLLMLEDAANSLESRIKSLDIQGRNDKLSTAAKNTIEIQKAELEKQVLGINIAKKSVEASSQSQLLKIDDKKTPDEIAAGLLKLDAELKNTINSAGRERKAIDENTKSLTSSANALDLFNSRLSALDTAISAISVAEARAESKISLLQARSGNPALSISGQESLQRQINFESINKLQTVGLASAGLRYSRSISESQRFPEGSSERIEAEKQAAFALSAETEAINGQIAAINESTSQIGSVKSSFVSLNDAILQFTRNLGESRGQNQFNLLQATDASSIVQGLIGERVYDSASGKGGAELVSFIADQNALLNEQFKIRTASSQVEKLELERQLDLTQQLLDIKNSNLSASEKQSAIEGAINANLEKRRTFSSGIQDATAEMKDRVNNFGNEFGKTTANAFRDGLSDAIKAAVSQTDNLKDALLDVALSFANKLRDAAINNVVDSLMSGTKGSSGGSGLISGILSAVGGLFGGAKRYASGGQITGGSGNKDDVPTLLMGGEYVIPKDVVNSYGKTFFDQIRNGSVGKMASGGYFAPGVRGQGSIIGKDNLLSFAGQTATSGAQDVRQTLRSGAGLVSLEPESLRASNFQRFGDSPIVQATQDAKDQAFSLYLDQLGQDKQYQEELAQYYRDLEEASAAQKKAKKDKQKQLLFSLATAVIGGAISGGFGGSKTSGETKYSGGLLLPPITYTSYRNSGGYGNGDTRQAMLSKDEFVLNSSATKNLGDKALYAINNGSLPNGESDNSAILAKLDELIQKTVGASEVSITVNTSNDTQQSSSQGEDDGQKNRMLAEKIKASVIQIIRDEKRPGGILTK